MPSLTPSHWGFQPLAIQLVGSHLCLKYMQIWWSFVLKTINLGHVTCIQKCHVYYYGFVIRCTVVPASLNDNDVYLYTVIHIHLG